MRKGERFADAILTPHQAQLRLGQSVEDIGRPLLDFYDADDGSRESLRNAYLPFGISTCATKKR